MVTNPVGVSFFIKFFLFVVFFSENFVFGGRFHRDVIRKYIKIIVFHEYDFGSKYHETLYHIHESYKFCSNPGSPQVEVIHPKLRVDQTMSQPPVTDVGTCVALTLVQSWRQSAQGGSAQ